MKHYMSFSLLISVITFSTLLSFANSNMKIDVNKATHIELEQIPGIGPTLAKKIISERDKRGGFRTINDLLKIQGIGRKKLSKLKKFLKVNAMSSRMPHSSRTTRVNF